MCSARAWTVPWPQLADATRPLMCSPTAQYRSIRAVFTAWNARRRAASISPTTVSKSAAAGVLAIGPFTARRPDRFGALPITPSHFASGEHPGRPLLWCTPSRKGTPPMSRLWPLAVLLVLPASALAKLEIQNVQPAHGPLGPARANDDVYPLDEYLV